MRTPGWISTVLVGGAIVLCMFMVIGPSLSDVTASSVDGVHIVPTQLCRCTAAQTTTGATIAPRLQSGLFSADYDEQLGTTFTQSFTSLEYNVTAVEQTDPTLGTGPAYLLNGLANTGYWYQVGISWDWSPGMNPGTGFDMNYEVFDSSGNSVFPNDGQGGIASFSGPIHAGDIILLDLYITNSTRTVTMLAKDVVTGAVASVSYSSLGAAYFTGLPGSVANSNGFFTGLMTEWYHGAPYYTNEAAVVYSNPSFHLTSAWLWMDEFNANDFQSLFASNTSAPISFTNPTKLQEFSYNGTTEYAGASEFVTGALTNTTGGATSIPLIFSYSVQGGGSGYGAPVLSYVSNGTSLSAQLTTTATIYYADNGSTWAVSSTLSGSSGTQRWQTNQTTTGTARSSEDTVFVYANQELVTFGYSVEGNASGYSSPTVTYSSFGVSSTAKPGIAVWVDVGSHYQYPSTLGGSNSTARWFTSSSTGTVGSSSRISATYYHQYLVIFDLTFENTEVFPAVSLTSTSGGQPYSATIVLGKNSEWLDFGAAYSFPQSIALQRDQRLSSNATSSGTVSSSKTITVVYQHQFFIQVIENVDGGGEVSPPTGWYDSGSTLTLNATSSPGWKFEGWVGSGSDSVSGPTPTLTMVVGPGAPSNESATFYPGISIDASGPSSVTYTDGSTSGSVSPGTQDEVYVPPSSSITLAAGGIPFLTQFEGWRGATNSTLSSVTVRVTDPTSVTGRSGLDYLGVTAFSLIVFALAFLGVWVVRARVKRRPGDKETGGEEGGGERTVSPPPTSGEGKGATDVY